MKKIYTLSAIFLSGMLQAAEEGHSLPFHNSSTAVPVVKIDDQHILKLENAQHASLIYSLNKTFHVIIDNRVVVDIKESNILDEKLKQQKIDISYLPVILAANRIVLSKNGDDYRLDLEKKN